MTSLPTRCHLSQIFKKNKKKNTKKPKRGQQAFWLAIISYNPRKTNIKVFFLQLQETTMSLLAHHRLLAFFPHL
jgi:hypothetical protein